jgi:hypothetical protein
MTKVIKKQFNSLVTFSTQDKVSVDREAGILNDVEIAKFGKNKNWTYFSMEFLQDLVDRGNANKQGVKSRFGHPNMCATSLGTYIGRFRDFKLENNKVYATLYLDPVTKKCQVEGKGITMFEYIMDMATDNPDMFGNSIVVYASSEYITLPAENDGEEGDNVESLILQEFVASDLVDDPAATDQLFSANPDDLGEQLTHFLDDHPQIFDILSQKPEMFVDFFERYFNYGERKNNLNINKMSKENFFKNLFTTKKGTGDKKFDIDMTLADGKIVTIKTDAQEPQVGDQVVDDTGAPVGADEYLLPNGGKIVTDDKGIITEYVPDEPTADPAMQEDANIKELLNSINTKLTAFEKRFGTLESSIKDTDKAMVTFANNVKKQFEGFASDFNTDDDGSQEIPKGNTKGYNKDEATKIRENMAKNKK